MTRSMADTIGANARLIPDTVDMVAGYDTGTPDVKWTDANWALFPNKIHVHIDQGFGDSRSAEAHVMVFDVEKGAFSPDQAEELCNVNQTPRPTIYVNRDNMYETIASAEKSPNWKGDIWLAFPGWDHRLSSLPPLPIPPLPGKLRYVAVQTVFLQTFDLSSVLDDSWPGQLNWTEEMLKELPSVNLGQTGPYVKRVQGLLAADGRAILIDGIFGEKTESAVKFMQSGARIPEDGIVGPLTWPVLLGL